MHLIEYIAQDLLKQQQMRKDIEALIPANFKPQPLKLSNVTRIIKMEHEFPSEEQIENERAHDAWIRWNLDNGNLPEGGE